MKKIYLIASLSACLISQTPMFAKDRAPARKGITLQDRYSVIINSLEKRDWKILIKEGQTILSMYPSSPFAHDVRYYLGIAYFHLEDFEYSNMLFSEYLKNQSNPQYFEEAIGYKFAIAQKFEEGAKRHLMGWKSMPKWMPGKEIALSIYDEVITSLPRNDLAAQSLYRKGSLLFQMDEYKQGIETFQSLIRRFPKHSLAPESYLGISSVFLKQCQTQFPDPDFLDLAEINLKKFKLDFPSEPRLSKAEDMLGNMRERFAKELYDTAKFFERTKKPNAACIYYKTIMSKYPNTNSAIKSKKRLIALNEPIPDFDHFKTPDGKTSKGMIVDSHEAESEK